MTNTLLIVSILITLICVRSDDEVDQVIPLPDWLQYHIDSLTVILYQLGGATQETPIIVWGAHLYTLARYQCIAYYSDSALDILTMERPFITTPEYMHTAEQRQLCVPYLTGIYVNHSRLGSLNAQSQSILMQVFEKYNVTDPSPPWAVIDDVTDCNRSLDCLRDVAEEYNYSPYIMASIIMDGVIEEFTHDGWNRDGSIVLNENGEEVECTANCIPFRDYTGYKPRISKDNNKNKDKDGSCNNHWQPLLESDGFGFLYRHEHVTPHIGIKGKRYLLDEYQQAVDPNYDYKKEGMDLILRLKELATSDYQKMAVETFDDKLLVRRVISEGLLQQYPDAIGNSFEMFRYFITGISYAEYEAILQAWNQKVKHDLIRPTTVIQRWGDVDIETYGGPYQGVKTIKAHDFEPYIRVMPHSEYPSGSACICKAYQEYTDAFVKYYFGDDSVYNMTWFVPAGSSKVEPGVTPSTDMVIKMEDMNELSYICSESRLWGGMHFRASVDEANRICSGIGIKAFELIQRARNNQTF